VQVRRSSRSQSFSHNTHAAAKRIKSLLLAANGGRLPRTLSCWAKLCARLGVPASALAACPPAFTARLFRDERLRDGWLIAYNPRHSARQVCRFLCHEIAEWLAVINYPSLFDGLPNRVYAYTGGTDPDDARHRTARRVEELCFRRKDPS